jgi:hypothetical protein
VKGKTLDLIIEVGTPEQKLQLEDELRGFFQIANGIAPSVKIDRIVVSLNFDDWVNKLQGTLVYKSAMRGGDLPLTAWARTIWTENESVSFVLSPMIYTEGNDTQVRAFVYIHELAHVVNRLRLSKPLVKSTAKSIYLTIAYDSFDEYRADRVAFQTVDAIFPSPSEYWQSFISDQFARFVSLVNDPNYYVLLEMESEATRYNADLNQFLASIMPGVGELIGSTVHAFALAHHYPEFALGRAYRRSSFVNEKTTALMAFFKDKYEQNKFDLDDGLPLVTAYVTNFGVMF